MTPTETAAQLRLAADILETGHPWHLYRAGQLYDTNPLFAPVRYLARAKSPEGLFEIRPILARPPYKAKLHNPNGLTAEQVGVGYRLAIVNEALLQDFYEFWGKGSKSWSKGCFNTKAKGICTYRLPLSVPWPEQSKPFTLPIQTLAQDQVELTSEMQEAASQVLKEEMQGLDPYADLKKAHADGKVIQQDCGTWEHDWQDLKQPNWDIPASLYRIKPDEIPWIEWHGGPRPLKDEEVEEWEFKCRDGEPSKAIEEEPSNWRWFHEGSIGDIIAYRVLKWRKKKPKKPKKPLEACDVPPGSVIRANAAKVDGDVEWWSVKRVEKRGVILSEDLWTWEELANPYYGWQINRSIPLTGKWNPDAWEACEK